MMDVKDEIKERLSIVDIVSGYVALKPAGKNYVGLSPFTTEKTPSFYVSPDRGLYYCFSTSQGGDMFTFVQKMEGIDFRGALKILAEKAGVSLRPEDRKQWEEKDVLFSVMEEATAFFEQALTRNTRALEYLKGRGLKDETIKVFRLGFAGTSWRDLKDHLLHKGYSENHIEKAGLIKHAEKGSYDRFRSRIMFPISDSSGRIIAFSGRIFIEDEATATPDQQNAAKYLNSPDTPLFNKSDVFFGLDKAKNAIKKYDFAILVEGQMDLLLLHQIGYTNTVAGSGTALTDKTTTQEGLVSHMGLVHRLTKNIVLAYDSDKAGVNAARKAARTALMLGMDTKVVEMPHGYDPADYVKEFGKDGWSLVLKQSVSIIEMISKRIISEEADPLKKGKRIRDEVLPEIALLPSAIEQDHYIKQVSTLSGIPETALQKDFQNLKTHLEPLPVAEVKEKIVRDVNVLMKGTIGKVFGLMWYLEDKEDFDNASKLLTFMQKFSGKLYDEWSKILEVHKQELVFESEIDLLKDGAISAEEMITKIENAALDVLRYLRPVYKRSIDHLEKSNDQEKMQKIMSDFNHVVTMIQNTDKLKQELYGTKKENNN
jgi:DNA primase